MAGIIPVMDTLEQWVSFRAGETPREVALSCVECAGPAEGNISDANGDDVCDACHAASMGDTPVGDGYDDEPWGS